VSLQKRKERYTRSDLRSQEKDRLHTEDVRGRAAAQRTDWFIRVPEGKTRLFMRKGSKLRMLRHYKYESLEGGQVRRQEKKRNTQYQDHVKYNQNANKK